MNILLCGNAGVFDGMELVIYTTLQHNKGVHFYVFTMDVEVQHPDGRIEGYIGLDDYLKGKLRKIVKYLDRSSTIKFIDVKELYEKHLKNSVNETTGFTPYTALRLIADIALPNVNETFYFDCDVAVTGDLHTVYNELRWLDCNYCASYVHDACDGNGEMVAGVLLLNLRKCRETGFLKAARRNYCQFIYNYPDQCALRDADTAYPMPEEMGWCYDLSKRSKLPLVIHFTNEITPKIYDRSKGKEYFYRRFPFLKYVYDGVKLIDTINF